MHFNRDAFAQEAASEGKRSREASIVLESNLAVRTRRTQIQSDTVTLPVLEDQPTGGSVNTAETV